MLLDTCFLLPLLILRLRRGNCLRLGLGRGAHSKRAKSVHEFGKARAPMRPKPHAMLRLAERRVDKATAAGCSDVAS